MKIAAKARNKQLSIKVSVDEVSNNRVLEFTRSNLGYDPGIGS